MWLQDRLLNVTKTRLKCNETSSTKTRLKCSELSLTKTRLKLRRINMTKTNMHFRPKTKSKIAAKINTEIGDPLICNSLLLALIRLANKRKLTLYANKHQ